MQFLLKLVYIYLNDSDKEDSTGADTPLSSGGKSDQKTGKQASKLMTTISSNKKRLAVNVPDDVLHISGYNSMFTRKLH